MTKLKYELPEWKMECIRYAETLGYEISEHCSMFLNNKRNSCYEVYDFSSYDDYIKSYPCLIIDYENTGIYTKSDGVEIKNFNQFKESINNLIKNYKKKLNELNINKLQEDFE